jgi:aspartyl-tRNA synthetase
MASSQERYYEILMERVRNDRYPSPQLLDRIEQSFWTAEQVADYVEMLLDKIDETWFPSGQLLDRVQRILAVTAKEAA